MSDLRDRVPGHGLVERLVTEWQNGHISYDGDHATVDDEARSWYRGVLGERTVAAQLARLGPEWLVLHSVPLGRHSTDIDHVAIGPAGVYTINTKYSPGREVWARGYGLYVDGQKTSYVPKAIAEARRASVRLRQACAVTVPVVALIVFVDPGRMSIGDHVGGDGDDDPPVHVTSADRVIDVLGGPATLEPDTLDRLRAVAIRPQTWHDSPPAPSDLAVAREFDALEAAVGPALGRPTPPPRAPRPARATRPASIWTTRGRTAARPANRRRTRRGPRETLLGSALRMIVGLGLLYWFLTAVLPTLVR